MKTELQILQRIKYLIERSWKLTENYTDKQKAKQVRQTYLAKAEALRWVLYEGQYKEICPYCGEIMECDTVDIGVGYQQCGPYYCENCHASEIHPNDTLPLDADEKETGYYKNRISPLANTSNGKLVNHKKAKELYEVGQLDNCCPSYLIKRKQ